ncbi:hypothetical protein PLESTB_001505400 [Pleodorina starrii]|uniref:Nascent polypeptide-associated complex subunit alpha-like UBA domain-containing protein n=1 Tax=Pleodorina starrii TaxID=330485 RepID=A0A9W6F7R9_9CHLO|nr:hypothetical protein PLESTM_000660400 [Pleodorina starrii]GLC59607.1 hypothetical protein PLESTB_001505400 [Pleodorina starrii]GLC67844.1 hypothetical protein PLESTF_000613400 [Pleodorina starrii]
MADDERDENDQEQEQEEMASKDRQGREAAAALKSMTDKAPEERKMDEGKVAQAMKTLFEAQKASKDAERQRERELAAVKVSKEDVDVLMLELEIKDRKAAERTLRLAGGDLRRALEQYLEMETGSTAPEAAPGS